MNEKKMNNKEKYIKLNYYKKNKWNFKEMLEEFGSLAI